MSTDSQRRTAVVRGSTLRGAAVAWCALLAGCASDAQLGHRPVASAPRHAVIVMVWDGMRPDSITAEDTPNLLRLRETGVDFSDHHSLFPTVTMMNAAALATGTFPIASGFYGNTVYEPGAVGTKADGAPVDFSQPTFSEDYQILEALDRHRDGKLLAVQTLFEAAQAAGLDTVAVGKSGPAFLLDRHRGGRILDENHAWPLALAQRIQAAGLPLPKNTPRAYPGGEIALAADNGDPTAQRAAVRMRDTTTVDGSDASGGMGETGNRYLMQTYVDQILGERFPDLSVVWLRDPDTTEHAYGPGSPNYHLALRAMDDNLGLLLSALARMGRSGSTDVIVVSDHGHSNVAGDLDLHPLRAIHDGEVGELDPQHGYSVSGEVRIAQVLNDAGFLAYDGRDCTWSPVESGIRPNGDRTMPDRIDADGRICGKPGRYTTPKLKVPAEPALSRHPIVVAINGGGEYLYLLDHDAGTARRVVNYLRTRADIGPIFTASRYGTITGALPMSALNLGGESVTAPDLFVTYRYDTDTQVQGMPGTEYTSMALNRGSHGSFSPRDVHNTLIGNGPDFRAAYRDPLPSANVDVAPTIAALLGVELPAARGRVLREALTGDRGVDAQRYRVDPDELRAPSCAATGVATDCGLPEAVVRRRTVRLGEKHWQYFDAGSVR